MTEQHNDPTGPRPAGSHDAAPQPERSGSMWSVLAPAAALLVGLVLGGVLVGVMNDDDDEPAAEAEATSSPTAGSASPSESATVIVIPDECLAAAESVEEALQLVERGAAALRDFQSAELRELLRDLEELDARARDQAEACQQVETQQSPSE